MKDQKLKYFEIIMIITNKPSIKVSCPICNVTLISRV